MVVGEIGIQYLPLTKRGMDRRLITFMKTSLISARVQRTGLCSRKRQVLSIRLGVHMSCDAIYYSHPQSLLNEPLAVSVLKWSLVTAELETTRRASDCNLSDITSLRLYSLKNMGNILTIVH